MTERPIQVHQVDPCSMRARELQDSCMVAEHRITLASSVIHGSIQNKITCRCNSFLIRIAQTCLSLMVTILLTTCLTQSSCRNSGQYVLIHLLNSPVSRPLTLWPGNGLFIRRMPFITKEPALTRSHPKYLSLIHI